MRRLLSVAKGKSVLRGGSMLIGAALLLAIFIRGFVLEPFYIPSSSMEKSLLVGDAVLVSKMSYGPRTPQTIHIPFTGWRVPGVKLPAFRLPGFSKVKRGDVMVFHYPLAAGPVDEKPHYIKRAIGLPGDWLSIMDKVPFVNGEPVPADRKLRQQWVAEMQQGASVSADSLRAVGADEVHPMLKKAGYITFKASRSIASKVEAWDEVHKVSTYAGPTSGTYERALFPAGRQFSRTNYGPIYVPAKGDRIRITSYNWSTYKRIISVYEGHDVRRTKGHFYIDGNPRSHYTFAQNYYFVLGDNRDNSSDSRAWGFVPASHLVGKAFVVYFSWNKALKQPRLGRLFKPIH